MSHLAVRPLCYKLQKTTKKSLFPFFFLTHCFYLFCVACGLCTSLVAQTVKHLPTMRETQVQSLGQEDPLEKEMATHSGIHAWKIPWIEEPDGLQSMGSQRVGQD